MSAVLKLEEARLQPQALEMECAVLGALMLERDAYSEVADVLRSEAFYDTANGIIYALISDLHRRGDPVDILTVTQAAKARGCLADIGGPVHVAELTNGVASGANIRYHAMIVVQKFMAREAIRIGIELQRQGYADTTDVFDMLAGAAGDIMHLNEFASPSDRSAAEIAREVVDTTEPDRGVPTHYPDLDRIFRMEPGTVTIVGARPGMGKTAFAVSLAWRHARMGGSVFFASMEMRDRGLVNRLICGESGVPVWKAKRRQLNGEQTQRMASFAIDHHAALERLRIDETAAMDTQSLAARIDRSKRKRGTTLVVVDYLQLMNVRGERFKSPFDRVSGVSEQLRIIAKQCDLPLVVLSQLSRGEKGAVRRPSMTDLRQSGQIEQDAEGILLLHRPKYYDRTAGDELEVIVAKNRDGGDGVVNLLFDGEGIRVVDGPPQGMQVPHPDNRIGDEPF